MGLWGGAGVGDRHGMYTGLPAQVAALAGVDLSANSETVSEGAVCWYPSC